MSTTAALVQLSDEELVERVRDGDDAAFETLVLRHAGPVHRLALRLCGDPTDAEEAMQDAFLRAHRDLASFRGDAKFSTWLFRVATNAALMHRRAARRHAAESLEAFLPQFDASGTLARLDVDYGRVERADELLERKELAEKARDAIARLGDTYRTVFVLHDLEGMTTERVAEILECTPDVVRQRLHRARLMLRGWLGHLLGEP